MQQHLINSLNKKYLNKWCIIDVETPKGNTKGGGVITYFGPNQILGWDFQITIQGVAINVTKLNSIKIYEEETVSNYIPGE